MKTLLKLLPAVACIFMLMSCEDWYGNYPKSSHKTTQSEIAQLPVNAYFNTTFYKNMILDGYMDLNGPVSQLVQTGSGTDDEIGYFQIRLTCCWSISDCVTGKSGGYLTDAMGNTIYIKCKECLTISDLKANYPSDKTCITGSFEFAGGTGKFEGATGRGTINCLVTDDGKVAMMSHHWEGFIKYAKPD